MNTNYEATILFKRNYASTAHIVINQGGTSSGKTYAIEQVLFCLACQKEKQVITIVGQDIPNLRAGALRDALAIYNSSMQLQAAVKSFNKTDRVFEFHNGTVIEFRSYADEQDAKSGKRDYLFINEANGITWNVYAELALRTKDKIFIDYNPNTEFWVHQKLIGQPNVELIISDHRHNPFAVQNIREKVEALREKEFDLVPNKEKSIVLSDKNNNSFFEQLLNKSQKVKIHINRTQHKSNSQLLTQQNTIKSKIDSGVNKERIYKQVQKIDIKEKNKLSSESKTYTALTWWLLAGVGILITVYILNKFNIRSLIIGFLKL